MNSQGLLKCISIMDYHMYKSYPGHYLYQGEQKHGAFDVASSLTSKVSMLCVGFTFFSSFPSFFFFCLDKMPVNIFPIPWYLSTIAKAIIKLPVSKKNSKGYKNTALSSRHQFLMIYFKSPLMVLCNDIYL